MINAGKSSIPLSVIVATFNRVEPLLTTLDHVLEQSFVDFELLVMDQSDPAGELRIREYVTRKQDPRLSYVHLAHRGLPNARDEGLARACGDIILFLDDDVLLLSRDFLTAHLACYQDPAVGGVVGRHVERYIHVNSRKTACHVSWTGRTIFNLMGTQRQQIRSCKGSNMSFRSSVVSRIGGFDRKTRMLEDTDFSVRVAKAGWKIMFEPDAEVVHLSSKQGGVREATVLNQEYRRFRSTAYFMLKHHGAIGCIPFLVTFSLIALSRVRRYRSLAVLKGFAGAVKEGFGAVKGGPEQDLPVITPLSEPTHTYATALADLDASLTLDNPAKQTRAV